jgi:hypothetical protein
VTVTMTGTAFRTGIAKTSGISCSGTMEKGSGSWHKGRGSDGDCRGVLT